ncbi:hypothetical protein LIER_20749 [Lithospermum erythrorhizon]|uniref:Uncharacterized protein n=1 Tax=Lithospermum erythrorhizon TaxID=34254 RepID=A0AAV3QT96_LITER
MPQNEYQIQSNLVELLRPGLREFLVRMLTLIVTSISFGALSNSEEPVPQPEKVGGQFNILDASSLPPPSMLFRLWIDADSIM